MDWWGWVFCSSAPTCYVKGEKASEFKSKIKTAKCFGLHHSPRTSAPELLIQVCLYQEELHGENET